MGGLLFNLHFQGIVVEIQFEDGGERYQDRDLLF